MIVISHKINLCRSSRALYTRFEGKFMNIYAELEEKSKSAVKTMRKFDETEKGHKILKAKNNNAAPEQSKPAPEQSKPTPEQPKPTIEQTQPTEPLSSSPESLGASADISAASSEPVKQTEETPTAVSPELQKLMKGGILISYIFSNNQQVHVDVALVQPHFPNPLLRSPQNRLSIFPSLCFSYF